MNFLIFRDFYEFILDFKSIKTIKNNNNKRFIFARGPCGCDVARKTTWQSHADPRERLRGAEVTCAIFIFTRII